jgi:hypothetical protein
LAPSARETPRHIDDFKLLIVTLVAIPLLIVFKQASGGGGEDLTVLVEKR